MLKSLFAVLAFVYVSQAHAATDCAIKAESYVVDSGSTQPARYMGKTREGELIFHVRANLRGSQSEYEIVLDNACDYRSLRLVWAQ